MNMITMQRAVIKTFSFNKDRTKRKIHVTYFVIKVNKIFVLEEWNKAITLVCCKNVARSFCS